jgi:hypothetical protein
VEVGEQGCKSGIVGGVAIQVQNGLNFLGGLTAGADAGEGERSGNVERREDQVRIALNNLFVGGCCEGV